MSKRYDEQSHDAQSYDEYEDVFKIADTRRSNHIQPFIPADAMNEQKKVIKTYSKDEVARIVFQTKLVDPDDCDDELAIRQRECRKHLQNLKVDMEEWESHETRKVIQDEDMEAWLNNLHLKSSHNKQRNSLSFGEGTSDGTGRLTPRRPSPSRTVHHHQPVSRPERSTITASPSLPVIPSSDTSSSTHYSRRATGSSVRPKITFDSSVVDKRSSSRNRSMKVTRKPSTTGSTSSYYGPSTTRKHPPNY